MSKIELIHGDCLDKLKELPDNSVDSIVCDPPYGLSFMGKKWDYDVPSEHIWRECLRVLKPGGHLLAFAGTRTQHRMAVRIEDAGFEIRDMIAWVYGSGFPKSLNIGKAVDKLQGNEREEYLAPIAKPDSDCWGIPNNNSTGETKNPSSYNVKTENIAVPGGMRRHTKGTSPYEGWGTALKPALEPITVARKPLSEKTIAENVLTHGTGGLNIDGCRVATTDKYSYPNGAGGNSSSVGEEPDGKRTVPVESNSLGRFPANLTHDGSEEVVGLFPYTKNPPGSLASRGAVGVDENIISHSAARFFYCAKASKKDRDEGLEGHELHQPTHGKGHEKGGLQVSNSKNPRANNHPTVKPTELMRYLCRLVTPKGGTVLDPFMGSGSTGKAAKLEGFDFIGIEREAEYIQIAEARINAVDNKLF